MSTMAKPRSAAGFTLVELLVASTIIVMIASAALMILNGTSAARQRIDHQREMQQQARTALMAVTLALRNAHRPADPEDILLEGEDGWVGDLPRDRIRLMSVSRRTIRAGQPESDVREVEFFILDPHTGEPPVLMRRVDPTRNPEPDGGGVLERVATHVFGLNLSYFDKVQWRDDWLPEDGWPAAIRVEIVVAPDASPGSGRIVSRLVNFPGLDDDADAGAAEQEVR